MNAAAISAPFASGTPLASATQLLGRILLATLFLASGLGKVGAYAATQGYMESQGVPGVVLPLVLLAEIGGGLAIVLGLLTRWTALALAGFSIATALVFHSQFADQNQMIHFLKNLAIAGGFLGLAVQGAGAWSLDRRFGLG